MTANRKPTALAVEREEVPIRDGVLAVRGLYVSEVLTLMRRNPLMVVEMYQRFVKSEDFGAVVLFLMTDHTEFTFELILTAADQVNEEPIAGEASWREILPTLPIEDFVELLSTVYRLTMTSDEALKKTLEIISGGQRLLLQLQSERTLMELEENLAKIQPRKLPKGFEKR